MTDGERRVSKSRALPAPARTSREVRDELIRALELDLVGPPPGHAFERELLPDPPWVWYLTGFLAPSNVPREARSDPTDQDFTAEEPGTTRGDDNDAVEKPALVRTPFPSSCGLSVLLPAGAHSIDVKVHWGEYAFERDGHPVDPPSPDDDATAIATDDSTNPPQPADGGPAKPGLQGWRRTPHLAALRLDLPSADGEMQSVPLPEGRGLSVSVIARSVGPSAGDASCPLPLGTRAVAVFLVNQKKASDKNPRFSFVFQAEMTVSSDVPFVPRTDPRRGEDDEFEDRVADLLYRDIVEFAVGHGTSTQCDIDENGECRAVSTMWLPRSNVERIEPERKVGCDLSMEAIANATSGEDLKAAILPLLTEYGEWLDLQRKNSVNLDPRRNETAVSLLDDARKTRDRLADGLDLLAKDAKVLDAFRMANRAMAMQARRREAMTQGKPLTETRAPVWRPFQLAFILMALRGLTDQEHPDRRHVDLLFFPTGGGKTEAYLGLAAFTIFLRRLRDPGPKGCGTTILMRYTLRLLTLDQLGRAAALICAMELIREEIPDRLGEWPFEIGLWVGKAATPNVLGKKGDQNPDSAISKCNAFRLNSEREPAPIPLENCPWCGEKFTPDSFRIVPNEHKPENLAVQCVGIACDWNGTKRRLPILGVDEPIYRRLPAFLIATVDKFAALPWTGECGALFGRVDRFDDRGFYGPCDTAKGRPIGGLLPGPDLIIQDELHLISGPLGTVAGLYETAIETLCERGVGAAKVVPKIIASTATARRAKKQITALFGRNDASVFPPPGPDRKDSFFAQTVPAGARPARLYLGIGAQGRSLKVVFLRTARALLSAAQKAWKEEGGAKKQQNAADPYMTLLGYFSSLRELGGTRRIVQDEVASQTADYANRRRRDPKDETFVNRKTDEDVFELTSRVKTNEVADAKRRLALEFTDDDAIDVALATNMISVGLDVQRLGLMIVNGQPKTTSEYIQATSRVGRDADRPGLVITLMNVHRPRDRSHYERFAMSHAAFYRAVEAASVTPFSPRALDRALAGALVGLARHIVPEMTPAFGAQRIVDQRTKLDEVARIFADRAAQAAEPDERDSARAKVLDLSRRILDDWVRIAKNGSQPLQYQREERGGASDRLIWEFLNQELDERDPIYRRFRMNRSMRDVEASVDIWVKSVWKDVNRRG